MAGPLPRKKLYRKVISDLYQRGYFNEWRQTQEVCREANKEVPVRWSQLYPSAIHRYVRQLPVEERYRWDVISNGMVREWKKI